MKTSVNSMPRKPMFKGNRFTSKIRKRIAGRFVAVGYLDGPVAVGFFPGGREPEEHGTNSRGDHMWIDSPRQIVAISEPFKFPKLKDGAF